MSSLRREYGAESVRREIAAMQRIIAETKNQNTDGYATLQSSQWSIAQTATRTYKAAGQLIPILQAFLSLLLPFGDYEARQAQLYTALTDFCLSAAAIEKQDQSTAAKLNEEHERLATVQVTLDTLTKLCAKMSADQEKERLTQDERIAHHTLNVQSPYGVPAKDNDFDRSERIHLALRSVTGPQGKQADPSIKQVPSQVAATDSTEDLQKTLADLKEDIRVEKCKSDALKAENQKAMDGLEERREKSAKLYEKVQATTVHLAAEEESSSWWITNQAFAILAMLKFW